MMKISICIPTYNRADLLREAIGSCLDQTLKPMEIIVCDDSTNDESMSLVHNFQKETKVNIIYLRNSPPLGQADNVNRLFENATGDKIVLLHDDDLLMKTALEKMENCFRSDKSIDVVYGKQYIIDEKGTIDYNHTKDLNEYFYRTAYYAENQLSPLEAGMVQQFPNDCYMIKAEIGKKVKYRTKEEIGNAGDFDFGFRLGLSGFKLHFIDEFTAKYRITESSVARSGTDSGYQAYRIITQAGILGANREYENMMDLVLKRKAPVAILQAIKKKKRKEAFNIYFSKWHRDRIFSLGGMRRLLNILS